MKTLLASALTLLTLSLSVPAAADSWNSGFGHNRHWGHSSFGRGWNRHDYGYSRQHSFRRHDYYRYGGRRDNYFSVSYRSGWPRHRRHHNYDNSAGALLGGIVIGSLLTNSHREYRPRTVVTRTVQRRPVTRSREIIYQQAPPAPVSSSGRRLLRDLEGNCFEITRLENGDELRAQLPDSACQF